MTPDIVFNREIKLPIDVNVNTVTGFDYGLEMYNAIKKHIVPETFIIFTFPDSVQHADSSFIQGFFSQINFCHFAVNSVHIELLTEIFKELSTMECINNVITQNLSEYELEFLRREYRLPIVISYFLASLETRCRELSKLINNTASYDLQRSYTTLYHCHLQMLYCNLRRHL